MTQKHHVMHGRDHKPSGADPMGPWDSTENVGTDYGVRSVDPVAGSEAANLVLTSDGAGGSRWAAGGPAGSLASLIRTHADLLAFWPLNDASGDAHDEGPFSLPLSPVGTPTYAATGPFPTEPAETAISFNGVDGFNLTTDDHFVRVDAALKKFDANQPFTMEVLALPSSLSQIAPLMTWTGSAGQIGILMGGAGGVGAGGYPVFNRVGSSSYTIAGTVLLSDLDWQHLIATYDGTTMRLYVNGVEADNDTAATIGSVPGEFRLARGGQAGTPNGYYKGRLAYAAVYTAALTPEEVAAHSAAGGATAERADAVVFTPAAGVAATDVQAAIEEVAGDITTHIADTSAAHAASAVAFTPTVYNTATDAQAAIAALEPAHATKVWMPLIDSDGTAVLDGSGNLIPTLIPL